MATPVSRFLSVMIMSRHFKVIEGPVAGSLVLAALTMPLALTLIGL